MTEIWKDIEGYEGYQVSNLGRVRSVDRVIVTTCKGKEQKRHCKGKIRKLCEHTNGYLFVNMANVPSISVHRAVAIAFVPGYFEGALVNHKDENKQNNRWDNLEWVTKKENNEYGTRCRLLRPVIQYDLNGKTINSYYSTKAASDATGIACSTIRYAVKTQRIVKGFVFKFKTN